MKRFIILDRVKDGDCFEIVLPVGTTLGKAVRRIEMNWLHMSKYDQKRRESFCLIEREVTESEYGLEYDLSNYTPIIDMVMVEQIKTIRRGGKTE